MSVEKQDTWAIGERRNKVNEVTNQADLSRTAAADHSSTCNDSLIFKTNDWAPRVRLEFTFIIKGIVNFLELEL